MTSISRRRFVWSIAGSIGALGLLAACGGPEAPMPGKEPAKSDVKPAAPSGGQAAPSGAVATKPAEVARPAAEVKVGAGQALLYVMYPPTSNEDRQIFQTLFDEFEKSTNDKIKIKYDDVAGQNIDQKVLTMLAGGAQIDSMRTHPSSLVRYASRNTYLATDDWVKRDNAEIKVEDLVDANYSMHEYKGKHYGLPYYAGPSAMYFNRDLFDKYGIEHPDKLAKDGKWTWEKLLEVGQKLSQGSGPTKTFGINAINKGIQYYLSVPIWSNGGNFVDDLKAPTKVTLDSPECMEALQFQADLQTKHKIAPEPADMQGLGGTGEEIFKSGRIGMLYTGRYRVPDIKDLTNFKAGHMPIPTGKKGRFMRDGGNGFPVMSGSKLRDETWQLVKFAASPAGGKILLKSTRPQPVRKSFYEDGTFEKALLPWEHLEFYLDAAKNDRIFLLPEAGTRFQAPFESNWDKMVLGQATIQQVIAAAQPEMNALLKDPDK